MESRTENLPKQSDQSGVQPDLGVCEPALKLVEDEKKASASHLTVVPSQSDGTHESEVLNQSPNVTPEVGKVSPDQAIPFPSAANSSAAFNSAYLTIDHSTEWPRTRKRQIFNIVYFAICAYLSGMFLTRFGGPLLAASACFSSVLLLASFIYCIRHRTHVSVNDELPDWSRKGLRALALLLPVAIIGGTAWIVDHDPNAAWPAPSHASAVMASSFESEMAQGRELYWNDKYDGAIVHFLNAVAIRPDEDAEEKLADSYLRTDGDTDQLAILHADRALQMNPNNVSALTSKAWALNSLERYKEALSLATLASKVDPTFGEAYASISNSQNGLGNHQAALVADNQHVKIHNDEAKSYSMRAETYKSLGRAEASKADAEMAKKLEAKEK